MCLAALSSWESDSVCRVAQSSETMLGPPGVKRLGCRETPFSPVRSRLTSPGTPLGFSSAGKVKKTLRTCPDFANVADLGRPASLPRFCISSSPALFLALALGAVRKKQKLIRQSSPPSSVSPAWLTISTLPTNSTIPTFHRNHHQSRMYTSDPSLKPSETLKVLTSTPSALVAVSSQERL